MNRSILSVLGPTSILLALLISCNNEPVKGPTILAGQLPDLSSREIKTWIGMQEYKISTDSEGRFHTKLDLIHPQYLWFSGISKNLYLLPGDSLYIGPGSANQFSGGESGLINTYYAGVEATLNKLIDTVDIKWYYSQEPTPYLRLINRVIEDFHASLDQFAAKNPGISKDFISLEKERIRHYWFYELNVYYDEYKAYTGTSPELPDDFYDYLETVRLNDTVLFQFDGYHYFLYSWLDLQARLSMAGSQAISPEQVQQKQQNEAGTKETYLLLNLAEQNFIEPAILADVTRDILQRQASRMKVDEQILANAEEMGAGEEFIQNIRKNVEVLTPLETGNPAMDFELLDVAGKTSSLEDFRGKYLLIDVWSHTCGPCLREIPRMEDLKHEMKGRNLEVIAVCLSNEKPWKDKMKEFGLPAKGQYRVEGGWSSQFRQDYLKFSGVPVYIIIDPEGKIVTARAPYPSKGLNEVLEGLPI